METTRRQKMNFWWNTTQFALSVIFIGNFAYFAMLRNRKNEELGYEVSCHAKMGANHPINITKNTSMDEVTNVG